MFKVVKQLKEPVQVIGEADCLRKDIDNNLAMYGFTKD